MVLKIFFSQDEIKQFFEANGFLVVQGTFGKWGKALHNQDEWNDYQADAVLIGNRYVEASKLFEGVAERRLKSLVAPTSKEIKNTVESIFKTLL